MLAKWLSAHPKVLILDNPTQGVDVGAKEEIYDIILRLAREGVAVVVLSSEAQEIIRVCDRALVLYHGALQGEVSGADMNEQTIMHLPPAARRLPHRQFIQRSNGYGNERTGKEILRRRTGRRLEAEPPGQHRPGADSDDRRPDAIMIYNFGRGQRGRAAALPC